jgi:hypothetical protein
VVSTSPTVTQLVTPYSVRWMVPMLIIIPQSLWEVVFTSPTVTYLWHFTEWDGWLPTRNTLEEMCPFMMTPCFL